METLKDINWLVSLIVAVPLSIAANLLTPYIRDWYAKRSSERAKKRIAEVEAEHKEISLYLESKDGLILLLLSTILRVLVMFSLASAIAFMGSIPSALSLAPYEISILFYGVTGALSVFLYLIGINHGLKALTKFGKVMKYEQYSSEVESLKSELREVAK